MKCGTDDSRLCISIVFLLHCSSHAISYNRIDKSIVVVVVDSVDLLAVVVGVVDGTTVVF